MGGGIIINRHAVLVTAAKASCLYDTLSADDKSKVDAIANKDPGSVTERDLEHLVKLLGIAIHC
jgi:hypothetical protein